MYAVFVPIGKDEPLTGYNESLGNAMKPVAYFEGEGQDDEHDRKRALDYADYLATVGEFAQVVSLPERYLAGSDYVGEIVRK